MTIAAWLLSVSLLVQVVQELYKYLSSSRSRAFTNALVDFAGPFTRQIFEPGVAQDLAVRGPFQLRQRKPLGRLLPPDKDTLLAALSRTTPTWFQLTQKALELEAQLQQGNPAPPSRSFLAFLASLGSGATESPGAGDANEMRSFMLARLRSDRLKKDATGGSEHDGIADSPNVAVDARGCLEEFRARYAPHLVKIDKQFAQLLANYEYAYRRRNLRQTFVIAFVLAVWFDFSFDTIYQRALAASSSEAIAAAEAATGAYASERPKTVLQPAGGKALPGPLDYSPIDRLRRVGWGGSPHYALGCLITAVFVCFGAPFWNDLAGSLLRIAKPAQQGKQRPAEDR